MSGRKNLIGNVYGLLTVIELSNIKKNGKRMWRCRCSCCGDDEVYALTYDLNKRRKKQCKGSRSMLLNEKKPKSLRPLRTLSDWIKIAERLAKDNNGLLPERKDRPKALTSCMYKHRDAFSHIPRKRSYTTKEEWVDIANRLTKENGGKLPSLKWLDDNGYSGLRYHLSDNPDLYSHLERSRDVKKKKTIDEWLSIAERFADANGGLLPPIQWLRKKKYHRLIQVKRNNPDIFGHLKYERHRGCRLTIEEMVEQANRLAEEHDGILPSKDWLNDHGYHGLKVALYKQPEHFRHITRIGDLRRSPEEWLEVAKDLVKEYGILPSMANIRRMGYDGLMGAIALYPEIFEGIPRHPQKSINLDDPGYFYFIIFEYDNRKIIKVGISRDVEGRHYAFMLANGISEILYKETYFFDPARRAHRLEQDILHKFKKEKVYPGDRFDGRTECFRVDAWEGILDYVDRYRGG